MNFSLSFFKKYSKKMGLFVLILGIIVSVDLSIKAWAETHLIETIAKEDISHSQKLVYRLPAGKGDVEDTYYIRKDIEVIPNRWSFSYVRNYDIGFSLLSWMDRWVSREAKSRLLRWVQLIAVIIMLGCFFYFRMLYYTAFCFIIGGGLGNVIDRIMRGYVVDYVKWSFPELPWKLFNPWPVFNLADSCVCVGILLLMVQMIFMSQETPKIVNAPHN